ncbi:lamin tail domain-containing protein [archaeon]|nr:lamin tail domain-containing protein [archaeon]
MKKILVLILLILVNSAFAVTINQVLFDPKEESGGEAVELWNPEDVARDISDWYLKTERSEKDITIPKNTFIAPKSYFLITDNGWNKSKDNLLWRNADYEESMTLNNADSFVELKNSLGELIERANWTAGIGLIKSNNTFIYGMPQFFGKNIIPIELIIENEEFFMLDENNKTGIQINPIAGGIKKVPLRVQSAKKPKVEFLEESYFMNDEKNGYYNLTLELPYYLPANNYSLKIDNKTIGFEYLRLEDYEVLTKQLIVKNNGILEMKNTGNVGLNLSLSIDIPINASLKTKKVQLNTGEEKKVNLEFNIPKNIEAGKYQGVLKIE